MGCGPCLWYIPVTGQGYHGQIDKKFIVIPVIGCRSNRQVVKESCLLRGGWPVGAVRESSLLRTVVGSCEPRARATSCVVVSGCGPGESIEVDVRAALF